MGAVDGRIAAGNRLFTSSLKAYVPAVLRQWWTYAGLAVAAVGYVVDVAAGLQVPSLMWIAVILACLTVAQFRAYHDIRLKLAEFDIPRLPQWALWAHNANADGAWLTLLLVGDAPKEALDTGILEELVTYVADHFTLSRSALRVETFADFLRIKHPNTDGVPEFLLQLSVGDQGIIGVQWRTNADPVPLGWILRQLDLAMRFSLLSINDRVVRRSRGRTYSVSFSNWPEGGIDAQPLVSATRLSQNYVRGTRVFRRFILTKDDPDGWNALRKFAAAILGDAGYTRFEEALLSLPRKSVTTN